MTRIVVRFVGDVEEHEIRGLEGEVAELVESRMGARAEVYIEDSGPPARWDAGAGRWIT